MAHKLTFILMFVSTLTAGACAREMREEGAPAAPQAATTPTGSNEQIEATVTQLEREWVAAIVKKDAAALDRLLADDFSGTSPTAHLYTKKSAIDDLTQGTYTVNSMELDEVSVNAYGNTAVAFTSQEEKSTYGDQDFSGHYHFTDVWAKRDGRWQAVASHGSRYATAH
jgi:ketosteroid isomerase-like protein